MSAGLLTETAPVIVRPASAGEPWNAYVEAHPAASGCHKWAWRDVIARAFNHETRYLVAETAEQIVGILPLVHFKSRLFGTFVVSMPFLNGGGVLASTRQVADQLLATAVDDARRAGAAYIELRHADRMFPQLQAKTHKVNMSALLETTEELQWKRMRTNVRNHIRKAQKSGITVVRGREELLDGFYRVFAQNMRDLGTPVYPRRFFEEILRSFPDATSVFCARLDGKPVAASFVWWHRDTLEVPWASSLREVNPLCANALLYWEMMRFAIERRFSIFDFGRCTPMEGTYEFKRQWGAQPRQLVWEYWTSSEDAVPDLSPANPKFRTAIAVWQRLPVAITRVAGPWIVRNIP